ncbi:Aspartate kinase, monofunctional class [Penicillium expansum]|uniref:Aspartate kinase, monofunctional class n=1 Tax=Penicillium expansum TaxID=27334 RepID=A0A0A2K0J6_PENEN|nr:Aspartate kinase, monofunctional class [Penicillium expansum]KGO61217.1 Aspartate kinase, monofunctional class [Penicillium expansum]
MTIHPAPKEWIVQKYGGTSLGKLLDKVCGAIIPAYLENYNVAVICSALSGTTKANGTTSLLLECLRYAEVVGVESISHINAMIDKVRDAHLDKLQTLRAYSSDTNDLLLSESIVNMVSDCEEVRKFLLAAQGGIPARVINLDNIVAEEFGGSLPNQTAEFERLGVRFYHRLGQRIASMVSRSTDAVPIITGFFGVMPNSLLQCVGRGYSDLCGAMCAAGLAAAEYQIWKEVDGIFTADPSKVPSARVLTTVTAEEVSELTFFGSEVIHPLTMQQLYESEIVLQLKNVLNPCGSGTVIYPSGPEADHQPTKTVQGKSTDVGFMLSNGYHGQSRSRRCPTAITSKEGLILVNVTGSRAIKTQGFLASVFLELERTGLLPDLVTTSERNVSLAIQASNGIFNRNRLVLNLQKFGCVSILENMNIVSVIGQQMRNMVGTAIVKADDAIQAMNVIHARALQVPTHLEQENTFIKGETLFSTSY